MAATTAHADLTTLLASCSMEITARDCEARAVALDRMPKGSEIFVADLPDQPPELILEAVVALRRGGLEPVPHLVARNFRSRDDLDDFLASLAGDAQVTRAFVTGGDRGEPRGPFNSAIDLLETGLLAPHGLRHLAFACYPGGHPRISPEVLDAALRRKLSIASERGFETSLVSQFAFDATPVLAMLRQFRTSGIEASLRLGTAGPNTRDVLVNQSRELGIGDSLSRIEYGDGSDRVTPEPYILPLAQALAQEPTLGISGAHLFAFGQTTALMNWVAAQRETAGA